MNCFVSGVPLADIQSEFFSARENDQNWRIIMTSSELSFLCGKVAASLNAKFAGAQNAVNLVGLLPGCIYFLCELTQRLTFDYKLHFLQMAQYSSEQLLNALSPFIQEENVVLIDDIVESGSTMRRLLQLIPQAFSCTCLSMKQQISFSGCDFVPKCKLAGFGIAFNGRGMNWEHIFSQGEKQIEEFRASFGVIFE
ncbi:Guanine_phosphoribosyltransferase [Hexamita inflata]|uniref:Guanine phosphoribosyltransferase n=1 Tax=Hexamita inflata TaxID=28002 RepID=A0AA86TH58_9EUKA|nr:Guanine phosphoribosyltransferase [Hexamita inflata]CAI9918403.1 Guanine phosphoribosyltransferase [Hexamita inflata]